MSQLHGVESFFGNTLRTAQCGGFRIREGVYSRGVKTPMHRHPYHYFSYTLEGLSSQKYARTSLECPQGTLVFHPAEESHSDDFRAPEVRVLQIEIEPERAQCLGQTLALIPISADLARPPVTSLLSKIYHEFRQLDELSFLAIEGLALELLVEASRKASRTWKRKAPHWLKLSAEIIEERFAEPLRLIAIAQEIGVHPVHLAREFHKHYGCTIGERVRHLRVQYACCEIVHSRHPLCEIALAAGFADQSHFTRTFRNQTGMTPAEFGRTFRHC